MTGRTPEPSRPRLLPWIVALVFSGLGAAAQATTAQPPGSPGPVWVPAGSRAPALAAGGGVLYEGIAGSLVSAGPRRVAELEGSGGVALDLRDGEALWLYLLEDAEHAEFEPPTRVLLRAGHEVLVATDGRVPRLTERSDALLRGLKQPVRLPREPVVATATAPRIATPAPQSATAFDPLVEQMIGEMTQGNYMATWQALDDFETRYTFASQNDLATQWILDRFRSFGLRADFHDYAQSGARRNVVATLPGAVDSTRVVYVCAHLDATTSTPTVCAPGADDNASGVAAVLEAARVLSQHRFYYTVKFAAFNGEEQGLVGSANYAADMAAAGEQIVGVYNLDMIAYRGTDAAPPDLVIYTNTASQPLATALSDAIATYLPGVLQPLVYVQAMGGSDHFSFWRYGYPAVLSIEAEAWSADFCPWYHTCNDRIENYPQDYPLQCARANLAALAATAVPLPSAGPFLVLGPVAADDDSTGGSAGDGDGAVNPGETVDLQVTVRNQGPAAATGVSGVLRSLGPNAAVLDSASAWDDILAGASGAGLSAFRVAVAAPLADGQELPFALLMTDDSGPRTLDLVLRVAEPALAYRIYAVDDVTAGNGNGVPDPGEACDLRVTLINRGARAAAGVQAAAATTSPHLAFLNPEGSAAAIPSGAARELDPAYRVVISPDAVDGEDLPISLSLSDAGGYAGTTALVLRVGSVFLDQMETDTGWQAGDPSDEAFTGRWARVDPLATVQGTQTVQPGDDHTPGPGALCFVTESGWAGQGASDADVDGGTTTLTSPVFDLARVVHPRVTYWRWYTNNLGSNPNLDYWIAQVSPDGGATWVDLERTTASANSWQPRSFLIEDFLAPSSQTAFRFVAGDTGAGSLVEAALDDFEIEGDVTPVGVPAALAGGALRLAAPYPNPVRGQAAISFHLPSPGRAVLQIFGVDGRLVRTLVDGSLPAGPHRVVWDCRGADGQAAPPGVYFCRLAAAGEETGRRIARVR
jgi:hypothetical protein